VLSGGHNVPRGHCIWLAPSGHAYPLGHCFAYTDLGGQYCPGEHLAVAIEEQAAQVYPAGHGSDVVPFGQNMPASHG